MCRARNGRAGTLSLACLSRREWHRSPPMISIFTGMREGFTTRKPAASFSMNTCNGCHGRESGTAGIHIFPRRFGEESEFSEFLNLSGSRHFVEDPVTRKTVALDEMGTRQFVLEVLLNPQWSVSKVERGFKSLERSLRARAKG